MFCLDGLASPLDYYFSCIILLSNGAKNYTLNPNKPKTYNIRAVQRCFCLGVECHRSRSQPSQLPGGHCVYGAVCRRSIFIYIYVCVCVCVCRQACLPDCLAGCVCLIVVSVCVCVCSVSVSVSLSASVRVSAEATRTRTC